MSETSASSLDHALPFQNEVIQHHHPTLLNFMKEWENRGAPSPVILLSGQAGIGKKWVSLFLAQWIFCEETNFQHTKDDLFTQSGVEKNQLHPSPAFKPCGTCSACLKILSKSHVNLIEIFADSDSENLKIDSFRKLKSSVGFSGYESAYQVVLIPSVERMTPQAANSMLKLLEEPPKNWIFILTTNDPTLLLSTLVSRCQIIRLRPFSPAQIQNLLALSDISSERQKICANLAQGSWNRALLFADDEPWKQRQNLFQLLEDPGSVILNLIEWTVQAPSHFEIILDLMEQWIVDLIRWSTTFVIPKNYPWTNLDSTSTVCRFLDSISAHPKSLNLARSFWITQVERISEIRKEILAPMNRKLLAQDLFLPWLTMPSLKKIPQECQRYSIDISKEFSNKPFPEISKGLPKGIPNEILKGIKR